MITEAQRRALFALREALNLCDESRLMLALNDDGPGMTIETVDPSGVLAEVDEYLRAGDVETVLFEHPE